MKASNLIENKKRLPKKEKVISFEEIKRHEQKLLKLVYRYIANEIKEIRRASKPSNKTYTPQQKQRMKHEIEMLQILKRGLEQTYTEERMENLGENLVPLDQLIGFCLAKALKLTEGRPTYTDDTIPMGQGILRFLIEALNNELTKRKSYPIDFSIAQAYDSWQDTWNSFSEMEMDDVKWIGPSNYF